MEHLLDLTMTERIETLKHRTLSAPRYLSLEQAKIITRVYRESPDMPVHLKRAQALSRALEEMPIDIDPDESTRFFFPLRGSHVTHRAVHAPGRDGRGDWLSPAGRTMLRKINIQPIPC